MKLLTPIVMLILAFAQWTYAESATPATAGVSFEVGFSPGGSSLTVVEKAIDAAKSEILMACYEFTSLDIAQSLENAAHRGVKVKIVADWKAAQQQYSQTTVLENAGIPVRLDRHYAIHHHKFMVIDGVNLETGSFNYTTGAIKHNAENALVLWNVPQIAAVYAREWERLWEESQKLTVLATRRPRGGHKPSKP